MLPLAFALLAIVTTHDGYVTDSQPCRTLAECAAELRGAVPTCGPTWEEGCGYVRPGYPDEVLYLEGGTREQEKEIHGMLFARNAN